MQLTKAEWEAKGRGLFGEDSAKWKFKCPACSNEMSIERARADFADNLEKLRAGGYLIEQECIGRHIPGAGCNWAAYGLFRGPVFVDGTPAFDFGAP